MNLFETYDIVKQIEDLKRKIKDLDSKFRLPYLGIGFNFLYYFWNIIVIGSIGIFLFLLIKQFIDWKHTLYHGFFSSFFGFLNVSIESLLISVAFFIALSVLYLIAKFIFFIINKIRNSGEKAKSIKQDYLNEKKSEESALESQKYLLESQLKYSDIPFTYRNYEALSWMVHAYNNKRADSYADLINLYEQHLQNKKQNLLLCNIKQENYQLKAHLHDLKSKK